MPEASPTHGGLYLGRNEGQAYWLLTDLLTFKADGKDTGGALAIVEVATGPDPGPPPHIHRLADESFYILEGTFEFTLDGQAFTADAGSFVYLPKGIVHTHQALKGTRARALSMQTPAGIEHFVEAAGQPAGDRSKRPEVTPAAVARVLGLAPQYGIDVPGTPGTTGS